MISMQLAALVLAVSGGGETVLLDFHADWCGPCRAMEPAVSQLIQAGHPVRKVNVDHERELAARYRVTSIPCFVLVSGGQEVDRLVGSCSVSELQGLLSKTRLEQTQVKQARGQSPDPPLESVRPNSPPRPGAAPPKQLARPGAGAAGPSAPQPGVSPDTLLAASVRLTVEDREGFSHGSGTIIDARGGQAMILTCGHIFRDSQGKGKITVDVFGPGQPQKLVGRLVRYDLKRDVGLLAITPAGPVASARMAAPGHRLAVGDRVISVGCDNGANPSVRESKVTSLNKFLGPANVQVAGQPVQGRSGGGLFDAQGFVVGVCNAADPADDEGLYAASSTIQEELDGAGLARLYQPAAGGAAAEVATASAGPSLVPPISRTLTPAETATLAELSGRMEGAEVICIVRSLSDPQSKSEIVVLDRASPAFMQRLAAEQGTQEARHLTSLEVSRGDARRTCPLDGSTRVRPVKQ